MVDVSKKALDDATRDAKSELKRIQEQTEVALGQFDSTRKEQLSKIIELNQAISALQHDQKVLSHTNATIQNNNRVLESEISVRQETVDGLQSTEKKLVDSVAELRTQQEQTEDQVAEIRVALESKIEELKQLDDMIGVRTGQFNSDISILEQKKQNLEQEIVENRYKDDKVRENLASWSKQLDERDKNLRIREARVNEQEKSIARNYNLLDL